MSRLLALSLALFFVVASAAAQDVVRVKYVPAYPMPDQSMEGLDIEIKRLGSNYRKRELAIDQYFAAVAKILADEGITANWERSVVHAPFVRVEVAVGVLNVTLGASYSANGLDSFPGPDTSNERHRRALEGILRLTLQRINERSPVKWP